MKACRAPGGSSSISNRAGRQDTSALSAAYAYASPPSHGGASLAIRLASLSKPAEAIPTNAVPRSSEP